MPPSRTGTITETPTSFRLRFRVNGVRQSTTLKKGDGYTRQMAENHLQDVLSDVRRGLWVDPKAEVVEEIDQIPTFAQMAERWLESRRPDIAARTYEDYKNWRLDIHLLPHFGDVPVDLITVQDVDAFRDEKKKRLCGSSVAKLLLLLSQVLELAEEYGFINRNPVNLNRKNRLRGLRSSPERLILGSAAEVGDLLAAADELDELAPKAFVKGVRRIALAVMVFGGLRRSEVCGLRWEDVDLRDGILTVRGTKTAAACRRVPLLPVLAEELALWRDVSPHTAYDDPVISTSGGSAWDPHNLYSRVVKSSVKRANEGRASRAVPPLPPITPHGLRRTAASIWVAIGWPPTQVMAAMGHKTADFTLSVYAKAMEQGDASVEELRELVGVSAVSVVQAPPEAATVVEGITQLDRGAIKAREGKARSRA